MVDVSGWRVESSCGRCGWHDVTQAGTCDPDGMVAAVGRMADAIHQAFGCPGRPVSVARKMDRPPPMDDLANPHLEEAVK
jgi:hypothetical protein